jgi:hypothetical protein
MSIGDHAPMTLLGADRLGDSLDRLVAAAAPERTVIGWATIELDRAERDLGRQARKGSSPDLADPHLGAMARAANDGGSDLLLLEPSTEGPLAAGLARHGEGPLALYLVVPPAAVERVRSAGFVLSPPTLGPLGQQRRVLTGPRDGPFLLLVTP